MRDDFREVFLWMKVVMCPFKMNVNLEAEFFFGLKKLRLLFYGETGDGFGCREE